MTEMSGLRWGAGQFRESAADGSIEVADVCNRFEGYAAGELFGDRADAKQRVGRERDPTFGIGPTPRMAGDDLAVAEDGAGPTRPGELVGDLRDGLVQIGNAQDFSGSTLSAPVRVPPNLSAP